MTMPHLMNCSHSHDGWCLECVKELHEDFETAEAEAQRLRLDRDRLIPVAYAASEFAAGRIGDPQLLDVVEKYESDNADNAEIERVAKNFPTQIHKVLEALGYFEQAANAGPDREVFQAYISQLFADGSGKLRVELASTQASGDLERLTNKLFAPVQEIRFDSIECLLAMLDDMDLVNRSHPEHGEGL